MVAFGGVTLVALLVLGVVVGLGDQRRFEVVLASPAEGDEVPSTIREIALTFSREPDRNAVEAAVVITPEIPGTFRWRGRTLVFAPGKPLTVGEHTIRIGAGKLGRSSEPLADPFELTFRVRQPGIAAVVQRIDGEDLVELRGGKSRVLLSALRITDFAISPDGTEAAAVTAGEDGRGALWLVPLAGGEAAALVQSPDINIGGVTWAPDASALLVIRRDTLPNGIEGVPRAWLMRRNGDFVAPIDPDGNPSLYPSWSPDGQQLAYVSPSDARLVVRNLSTEELRDLGQPRGGAAAWSADSTMVAFESVAPTSASNPPQPVSVRSIDGSLDRTLGVAGEIRLAPKFWDGDTVATLRRQVGVNSRGTELVFESIRNGSLVRAISLLGGGNDLILDWDLDPSRTKIVFAVRSANRYTTIELDLETGQRRELEIQGKMPKWSP